MAYDDRQTEQLDLTLTPEELRLAERLRSAREYIGLTQDTVAKALGIPRSAVSALEAGKRKVAFLELQQLARLYRRPLSFFSEEDEQELLPSDDVSRALHRAAQKLSDKDRQQVLLFARFLRSAGGEQVEEEEDEEGVSQKS